MNVILMKDLYEDLEELIRLVSNKLFLTLNFKISIDEENLRWLYATSEINIISSKSLKPYYILPVTTYHMKNINNSGFIMHKHTVKDSFIKWLLSNRELLDKFTLKESN